MTADPLHPTAAALRRRLAELESKADAFQREVARTRSALASAEELERQAIAEPLITLARGCVGLPLREARTRFEVAYLSGQLSRFRGNVAATAKFVGMERSALTRKLVGLGISYRHREPA